ncbi:GAF domain-containing protein [Limibacter armeniacum]|uniref:GAF domain-containing protein n=1 Tax=Limibacter armeniacum TaxID=466084 RepID=UPI002FE50613
MLHSILTLGTNEEAFRLDNKYIRRTNLITVGAISFLLIFTIVAIAIFPFLALVPIVVLLTQLLVLALMAAKMTGFAKMLLSVSCLLAVHYLNAFLVTRPKDLQAGMYMLEVVMLVLPFSLYHRRDLIQLLGVLVINLIIFSSMDDAVHWLNMFMVERPIDLFGISIIEGLVAVAILFTMFFVMLDDYGKSNQKISKLEAEIEELNNSLSKAQEDILKLIRSEEEKEQLKRKETWKIAQLTSFTEVIRSVKDLQKLYDEIVSKVVQTLSVNQVALYLMLSEDNPVLQRVSCFAFDRKKFLGNQLVHPNEGLVGQCFVEEKAIRLDKVPQGYYVITSGLGEASAEYLVLIPLKVDDKVIGVMELASFRSIEDHEIDFLEHMGESLSFAIASRLATESTKELLNKTKAQAEILMKQESQTNEKIQQLEQRERELIRELNEYKVMVNGLEEQENKD